MAYFNICPECGCHLDPGEHCDCKEEREREKRKNSGGELFAGFTAAGGAVSWHDNRAVGMG